MSNHDITHRLPTRWSADKHQDGLDRFNRPDLGPEFIRQCALVFPGVPPEMLMGFALNAKPGENTTGYITGGPEERPPHMAHPPLGGVITPEHELGMFGVEGGPRGGLAPGPGSNWSKTAVSAEVVAVLGRTATVVPGGWRSLPDQIAVGLVNTRQHGRKVAQALPASVRPGSEHSFWFVVLCFMGWSAGDGRAVQHLGHFTAALAAAGEDERWRVFVDALNAWAAHGTPHVASGESISHASPFWTGMRTLQKLQAGIDLAAARHGDTVFFHLHTGAEKDPAELTLTTAAVKGVH